MSEEYVLNAIVSEGEYCWYTDDAHADNSITMSDFIDFDLPVEFAHYLIDESYAEIINVNTGKKYKVEASGNGDFYSHKVSFTII